MRMLNRTGRRLWLSGLVIVAAWTGSVLGQTPGQRPAPANPYQMIDEMLEHRYNSGQSVAPVYEGWEPNPDGTFTLHFGYMNYNWEETLDIPVGPNNLFEPGPQDRGQAEHFLTRRRKLYFGVVVPKDFGNQTLTWTLKSGGKTERVAASMKPIQQIDVSKDTDTGNMPPKVEVGPARTATVSQPLALSVAFKDDGLPKPRRPRAGGAPRPLPVGIEWSKYRGPGNVTFSKNTTPIADGKSDATATFDRPGVYQIQVLGNDGSLTGNPTFPIPDNNCCWTTEILTVTVK